ncbi:MAG: hypothetical protein ABSE73_09040 [Planctomycetota bacterium]
MIEQSTASAAPAAPQDPAAATHGPPEGQAAPVTIQAAPSAPAQQEAPQAEQPPAEPQAAPELPGVFATIGALPPGAMITEPGLAKLLGKCTASIKAAVKRGELPWPIRVMGKNTWTAGSIVRHLEARLEKENRKFQKLCS